MNVTALDHVALRIPADGLEAALDFYRDRLGLATENVDRYRRGELDVFSVRLTDTALVHFQPIETFERPTDNAYDHLALVVDEPTAALREGLADAEITVEAEADRLGATGVAPAFYVRDPFGYRLELKATAPGES